MQTLENKIKRFSIVFLSKQIYLLKGFKQYIFMLQVLGLITVICIYYNFQLTINFRKSCIFKGFQEI